MMANIRAEFRKLFSMRSVLLILLGVILIVIFFAFIVEGIKSKPVAATTPDRLMSEITGAIPVVGIFSAIIGILLITHEYRYNTIIYTLTASKSRLKVLLAKIIVLTLFSLVFTLTVVTLSPSLTWLAFHLRGIEMGPQQIYFRDVAWRTLFFGWGFTMYGLLIGTLLRNQIASIVIFFIGPNTVEGLLSLLLHENVKYLPFNALSGVMMHNTQNPLSYVSSAMVVLMYLVVGWAVASYLFVRRDAT